MEQSNYKKYQSRREKALITTLGTTQLHLRSPIVIACWSMAFPGLGHLLLSKYIRGFLLFIWEVIINYKAHINLALLYSFTGDFEKAKNIIDLKWMLLYMPSYIFAIWDSYRTTVDLNLLYLLAAREDAEIKAFTISSSEINYLDRRSPSIALIWSILAPGTGQLYIHRILSSVFNILWWIAIIYYSNVLSGVHYALVGNFRHSKAIVNPHWILNIPSVYMFSMYDAFVNTVENNKLYDWEQSKFLKRDYQSKNFIMPFKSIGDSMYIFSTFEYSVNLELAITAVEMKGIKKENILAVPLDKKNEERTLFDSLHYSDGVSMIDLAAILGTVFGIFGSIYGFIFKWGPIIWGLIGIVLGIILGLIIKLFIIKKHPTPQEAQKNSEVVLLINCDENNLNIVKEILWANHALAVSKLDIDDSRNN